MEDDEEAMWIPEPSEDSVYGEASRDDLIDDDGITSEEAGFMKGYMEA